MPKQPGHDPYKGIKENHPDWTPPTAAELAAISSHDFFNAIMQEPPGGYSRRIVMAAGKNAVRGDLTDLQPAQGSK